MSSMPLSAGYAAFRKSLCCPEKSGSVVISAPIESVIAANVLSRSSFWDLLLCETGMLSSTDHQELLLIMLRIFLYVI